MRTLATVQKIIDLKPIPEADKIECAYVLGWTVVVKKDEFKIGESIVYIEVDSIVPRDNPIFDFLAPRKYRVRTIKLKKQLSQGIIFKLSDFNLDDKLAEGTDLTEKLKIVKYDPEALKEAQDTQSNKKLNPVHKYLLRFSLYRKLQPKRKKGWPEWLSKTDEERIQNYPYLLRDNQETDIYVTEKLDGQSASYFYKKEQSFLFLKKFIFGVCSRNIWLKTKIQNNYWRVAIQFDLQNKLKIYNYEMAIQGEIVGEGIQKNKYNIKGLDFYVFNIYDIKNKIWYGYDTIEIIATYLGLKVVPLIYIGKMKDYAKDIPEIVQKSNDKSALYNIKREGIVVRQKNNNKAQRELSFKVISPEFLLKNEKGDD